MRPASIAQFVSAPVARYVVGRNWVYYCALADLADYVASADRPPSAAYSVIMSPVTAARETKNRFG